VTKAEFVKQIRTGTTQATLTQAAASEIVDLVFTTMTAALQSEATFRFPGFGTFTRRQRAARPGRHPRTGKPLRIKASSTVIFRPAAALKQAVAGPQRRKKSSR
jgi:nucleoid DNA-binding protein